jgi:WD40 repeat protein
MPSCPPADTLSRFLLDALSGDEPAAVEAHVEGCRPCQETLRRLARLAAQPAAEMMNSWNGGSADANVPPAIDELLNELSQTSFSNAVRRAEKSGLESPVGDTAPWDEHPRVEGYEILDELGRGGMGVVYRARHLGLDRQVALKMVLAGATLSPQSRQRLQQEARAVGRLRYANIVQVYDVGEQSGRPFLAMELVEGGSLAAYAAHRPQPPNAAARLIDTLARAVQYAHDHGVVHRDLKPGNVLLQAEEGKSAIFDLRAAIPKITDFGLAKDLESDAPALTHSGAMLGTPSYMAPEQARGRGEAVGPAADVYSLGAILYELLTGRPPFRAATPLETMVQVVHYDPVPISRLEPTVPRDLATVCQKCLEKEPGRRYASAAALADDLHRFLAHEPIVARPVGPIGRLRRWVWRNPVIAAVLTSAGVLAAVALGTVLWQWREAVSARNREVGALIVAQTERDAADAARRLAERNAVALRLDRGVSLCEMGDTSAGLTTLARTLEDANEIGANELEPVLRANIAAWAGRIPAPRDGPLLKGIATCLTYSADGRRLFAARTDIQQGKAGRGEILAWEVDGWLPFGRPMSDPEPLLTVACSADGSRVVSCSSAGAVRLWDTATGSLLAGPFSGAGRFGTVAISPDGRRFMAGGPGKSGRGEACIWTAPEGNGRNPASVPSDVPVLVLEHPGRVTALAFTPDGTTAVTGYNVPDGGDGLTGGEVQVWDATTGKRIGRPIAHARPVTALGISIRGRNLVTGSADLVARIWNLETGQPVGVPRMNPFPIETAAFADDGKTIVTAGGWRSVPGLNNNCGAILWDAASGRMTNALLSTPSSMSCAAIRPGGHTLVAGGRDGRIRLYDIGGKRPLFEQRFAFPLSAAVFSSDDRFLLTAGGLGNRGSARLWNLATGQAAGPSIECDAVAVAAAFDPNGQTAFIGTRVGGISSWDAAAGRPADTEPGARARQIPPTVSLDSTGRILMVFARKGDTRYWEAATGRPSGIVPHLDNSVTAVAFSPDGRRALIGEANKTVRAWDTTTGQAIGDPRPVGAIPWHIAFSPDGSRFLIVGGDGSADWGRVQVWDAATLKMLSPVLPPRVAITAAAFDPHGQIVATGGRDGDVRLWDALTGRSLGPPLDHTGVVRSVSFDGTGRRLAVAAGDGVIRVWPVPQPVSGSPAEVRRMVEQSHGQMSDSGGQNVQSP